MTDRWRLTCSCGRWRGFTETEVDAHRSARCSGTSSQSAVSGLDRSGENPTDRDSESSSLARSFWKIMAVERCGPATRARCRWCTLPGMAPQQPPPEYTTTTLAIAAYIMAHGVKLQGISRNDQGRVRFDFELRAQMLAQAYESGQPVVAKEYYRHLTQLRAMVRDL
jgi:hypothetical protein